MRCKSCEYSLWNLTARKCPECGAPFKPSEFEFKPNAVCFCCPHCEQTYYGTTIQGHLSPEAFDCVKCGQHVHMDEMILRPTEGVEEQDTRADYNPWLERQREGRFKSWMRTIGRSLVAPVRLMRSTPSESSTSQAWWFAIATSLGMMLGGVLLIVPFILILFLSASQGGGPNFSVILMSTGIGLAMSFTFAFIFIFLVVGIWGAVVHGLLSITGHVEHGIGRTYQAICYSSGANITSALVCCGGQYWGWIWWCVSAILMVKEAQRTSGLRASFAVLTLPVVFVFSLITFYSLMVGAVITRNMNSQGALTSGVTGGLDTTVISQSILDYSIVHQGQGPGHGLELVADGDLKVMKLVPWSSNMESTKPLFPETAVSFKNFVTTSDSNRKNMAQNAVAAMPPGLIAHRVGDFVFTHHGINVNVDDPNLWIVMLAPIDPNPTTGTLPGTYVVGLADGTTLEFPVEELTMFRLDLQNAVRAKSGLAPLPDPSTITTTQPAIANP